MCLYVNGGVSDYYVCEEKFARAKLKQFFREKSYNLSQFMRLWYLLHMRQVILEFFAPWEIFPLFCHLLIFFRSTFPNNSFKNTS